MTKQKIDLEQQRLCLGRDTFSFPAFDSFPEASVPQPPSCSTHAQSTFLVPPGSEILVPAVIQQDFEMNSVGVVDPRGELAERYNLIGRKHRLKLHQKELSLFDF